MSNHGDNHSHDHKHQHFIIPDSLIYKVGGSLFVLTAITVGVAHVNLGALNFLVAMLVATVKALLVALFFMGLKYDRKENGLIFATSFLFLLIFFFFTSIDIFWRTDRYTNKSTAAEAMAFPGAPTGVSKLKKPWVSTPELVEKGKVSFAQNCVVCHGAGGAGDGVAGAALVPKPRNFTQTTGWKNGRKPTMVFKTLKEGIKGGAMNSYASLPLDERWALTHYVLSLAPNPEADTTSDFAKAGIDPSQESMGGDVKPTLPLDFAIDRVATDK